MARATRYLIAAAVVFVGCGRTDDSGDFVRAEPPPPPLAAPLPQSPRVLALLAPLAPEFLPPGYANAGLKTEWLRPETSKHGALGKVTIDLTGPWASQKLSFTVFPDGTLAKAGFADIAIPPAGRNIERTVALTPPGFATELWGEDSFERYGSKPFVRTSLATTVDGVIVLAQVHVEGEAQAATATDAAALLKAAIAHVAARAAATPTADGSAVGLTPPTADPAMPSATATP